MALDLPAFERPANAISGAPGRGSSRESCTDTVNTAFASGNSVKFRVFAAFLSSSFSRGFRMRVFTGFAGLMALVYASAFAAEAPAPKADPERGKQIATTVCAACHGADGNSTAPANPNLAGQHSGYIAAQLAAFKSGARPSPIMQGMAAGLSPEDMANVGAYFERQKAAGQVARERAGLDRAEKIWRSGIKSAGVPACAGCHGAAGHGIPVQYPRLAGQHADLSYGWLKAYASGQRPHAVMTAVASRLDDGDMKALSNYISGLR